MQARGLREKGGFDPVAVLDGAVAKWFLAKLIAATARCRAQDVVGLGNMVMLADEPILSGQRDFRCWRGSAGFHDTEHPKADGKVGAVRQMQRRLLTLVRGNIAEVGSGVSDQDHIVGLPEQTRRGRHLG